jgi:hypothetical protein
MPVQIVSKIHGSFDLNSRLDSNGFIMDGKALRQKIGLKIYFLIEKKLINTLNN